MSLGTALILTALSLFFMNWREDSRAGKAADAIVPRLEEQVREPDGPRETSLPDPLDPEMTEVEIDGHFYIGYVYLEPFDLTLPVMSDWSYDKLQTAPCRFGGSTKTNDLVLMAHNYAKHFGQLGKLSEGDCVYFTDMDGVVTKYTVSAVEILQPTAVEDMLAGEYDLTLFTCTYGGKSRVTVRCDRTA